MYDHPYENNLLALQQVVIGGISNNVLFGRQHKQYLSDDQLSVMHDQQSLACLLRTHISKNQLAINGYVVQNLFVLFLCHEKSKRRRG